MEGNQQKMREALVAFVRAYEMDNEPDNIEATSEAYEKARAALSIPLRQCEVGTPEEQARRYKLFCENHSGWDGQKRFGCLNCPFIDMDECEFAWAHMPYEAEEGGAK